MSKLTFEIRCAHIHFCVRQSITQASLLFTMPPLFHSFQWEQLATLCGGSDAERQRFWYARRQLLRGGRPLSTETVDILAKLYSIEPGHNKPVYRFFVDHAADSEVEYPNWVVAALQDWGLPPETRPPTRASLALMDDVSDHNEATAKETIDASTQTELDLATREAQTDPVAGSTEEAVALRDAAREQLHTIEDDIDERRIELQRLEVAIGRLKREREQIENEVFLQRPSLPRLEVLQSRGINYWTR